MTESHQRALASAALYAPFVVFLIVYAPAVGHGFISDDFRWIVESRIAQPADLVRTFSRNTGFYRPMVALTFAADYAAFGSEPFGYGVTNLALAIGCAVLLFVLIRGLRLPKEAAAFGAALWLLHFHGSQMAILWISGRTALVLVAASLAAAISLLRARLLLAALFLLVALFAKEEAIALPLILLIWLVVLRRGSPSPPKVHPGIWFAVSCAALAVYVVFRARSGAMTPGNVPSYYQFTFAPAAVADNLLEYTDRTLTFPAAVCLLAFLLLRPAWRSIEVSRPTIVCGIAWILGGYALTMFLPVRSSLYACFPSIGASILAAEIGTALWRHAPRTGRLRAAAAAIAVVIALIPFYRARNHRWVDLADFSSSVLAQLRRSTASLPDGARVVLIDERDKRINLEAAFGTLINDAWRLQNGRPLDVWIEPPLRYAPPGARPCPTCAALTLQLKDGVIVPTQRRDPPRTD